MSKKRELREGFVLGSYIPVVLQGKIAPTDFVTIFPLGDNWYVIAKFFCSFFFCVCVCTRLIFFYNLLINIPP